MSLNGFESVGMSFLSASSCEQAKIGSNDKNGSLLLGFRAILSTVNLTTVGTTFDAELVYCTLQLTSWADSRRINKTGTIPLNS